MQRCGVCIFQEIYHFVEVGAIVFHAMMVPALAGMSVYFKRNKEIER